MVWKGPLKGIVTPLVTPLISQDVIDKEGTTKLIEHVISGGVTGIFLLGSTGEGPSLSYAARTEFIEYCCQQVSERNIPVLVSVSDTAFAETISLARVAHKAGASALVLTTPFYFTMSQIELIHYVEKILKHIPSDMPLLLYNIPFLTTNYWDVETVRELATRYPSRIVGIKDSSGDLDYFKQLCQFKQQERPDFTVMIGPEHLLPQAIQAGGDGGVNGGSNVAPRLFTSLYHQLATAAAADNNNKDAVDKMMESVNQLQELYQVQSVTDHPFSRFIAGTKGALAVQGICKSFVNEPFTSSTEFNKEELLEKIRAILEVLSTTNDLV